MSRERDPGRSRCSGPPSTHLQGRLVLTEAGLGTRWNQWADPGMRASSPEGKGIPAGLAASPSTQRKEARRARRGQAGGGGSTRQCSSGSQEQPSQDTGLPPQQIPTLPLGAAELDTKAHGVAGPSICQADSGACLTLRLWGLGPPSCPRQRGSQPAWSPTGHFQRCRVTNNYNVAKLHIKYTFPYADTKGFFKFHVEVISQPGIHQPRLRSPGVCQGLWGSDKFPPTRLLKHHHLHTKVKLNR